MNHPNQPLYNMYAPVGNGPCQHNPWNGMPMPCHGMMNPYPVHPQPCFPHPTNGFPHMNYPGQWVYQPLHHCSCQTHQFAPPNPSYWMGPPPPCQFHDVPREHIQMAPYPVPAQNAMPPQGAQMNYVNAGSSAANSADANTGSMTFNEVPREHNQMASAPYPVPPQNAMPPQGAQMNNENAGHFAANSADANAGSMTFNEVPRDHIQMAAPYPVPAQNVQPPQGTQMNYVNAGPSAANSADANTGSMTFNDAPREHIQMVSAPIPVAPQNAMPPQGAQMNNENAGPFAANGADANTASMTFNDVPREHIQMVSAPYPVPAQNVQPPQEAQMNNENAGPSAANSVGANNQEQNAGSKNQKARRKTKKKNEPNHLYKKWSEFSDDDVRILLARLEKGGEVTHEEKIALAKEIGSVDTEVKRWIKNKKGQIYYANKKRVNKEWDELKEGFGLENDDLEVLEKEAEEVQE